MSNYQNEKMEAIRAGNRALDSLYAAKERLSKASSWGIFDIFGGGVFTSLMKHRRIEEAQECMEDAKYDLQVFVSELLDVNIDFPIDVDFSELFTVADIFLDNIFVDIAAQRKIKKTIEDIDHLIYRVNGVLNRLR